MLPIFVILAAANVAIGAPLLGLGLLGTLDPLGLIRGLNGGQTQAPSTTAIANAREQWLADTVTVSGFLSTAESLSPSQITAAANKALSAENDELTHKAVLDRQFLSSNADKSVRQANNVLVTQGTFQFVVNGLQQLATRGASMSPEQIATKIRAINEDRCTKVLPSIDAYFAAVGSLLGEGGAKQAKRPTNCPKNN